MSDQEPMPEWWFSAFVVYRSNHSEGYGDDYSPERLAYMARFREWLSGVAA